MHEKRKTNTIAIEWNNISPMSVTSDGMVMLKDGRLVDFMDTVCNDLEGKRVAPLIKFYSDTIFQDNLPQRMKGPNGDVVCVTCREIIPANRPVFFMSNGMHLYPCANQDEWVWWDVIHLDVRVIGGEA